MSEAIKAMADIFSGKGGTIRLAIFGSLFSAVIYEILDSKYDLSAKTSSGASISLTPASERAMTNLSVSDCKPSEGITAETGGNVPIADTSNQTPTESQTEENNG